jgi:UDP-glucose 4-epimerase
VAKTLAKNLCAEDKVVVVTKEIRLQYLEHGVSTLKLSPDKFMFEELFRSYQFRTVIFLTSRHLRNEAVHSGELDDLNRVLKLAARVKAGQVICISSTLVCAEEPRVHEDQPSSDIRVLLNMAEQLCLYYKKNMNLNVTVLHVPYLYGEEGSDLLTHDFLKMCVQKETIHLPGGFNDKCDFLSENDLADFISRLINSPQPSEPCEFINLGRSSVLTFGMIANQLSNVFSGSKFEFSPEKGLFPLPAKVEWARKHYGWAAMDYFMDNFSERINKYVCCIPPRKSGFQRFPVLAGLNGTLVKWIELIGGLLLMEYLNHISQTYAQFQFVDFRLLYVVMMGCIHGLQAGIYAALLSSASYTVGYLRTGMNWETLFYNIDNWLPLVSYFIAGSVTGYGRDKQLSREQFIKNQYQTLEDRYSFLNKMHEHVISNKEQLKQQLIGYRNSYGRLYDAICRLEAEHPEEVILKAIPLLETMLDTKSIAIYTLDQGTDIARLAASSESCASHLQNTMKLFEYPHIRRSIAMKEVWCNKALNPDEPAYCAPLSEKGEVKAMIVIWKPAYEQMTASYFNLFKVICGLVELSFARTNHLHVIQGRNAFLPGTRILKNDEFVKLLRIKDSMKAKKIARYKLLKVEHKTNNMVWLSNVILSGIRSTDVLGQLQNGELYILVSQADEINVNRVFQRLKDRGVNCTVEKGLMIS